MDAEITLSFAAEEVSPTDLAGFFVGWPTPPVPERRRAILLAADEVVLAWAGRTLVGFVTALTDRTFAACVPLLEVLPAWQGRGIGQRLMTTMLDRLRTAYMVDLVCDADLIPFYARLGAARLEAMAWRRYDQLQ